MQLISWAFGLCYSRSFRPFSLDNYHSLTRDGVSGEDGLAELGITATPLEAIAPLYLGTQRLR